jgi:NitT/TauT family transport system ATP-binding protein
MEVAVPRPRSPQQFTSPEFLAARRHLEELIHPPVDVVVEKLPMVRMTEVGDDVE